MGAVVQEEGDPADSPLERTSAAARSMDRAQGVLQGWEPGKPVDLKPDSEQKENVSLIMRPGPWRKEGHTVSGGCLPNAADLLCASDLLSQCKNIWGQTSGVLPHGETAGCLLQCVMAEGHIPCQRPPSQNLGRAGFLPAMGWFAQPKGFSKASCPIRSISVRASPPWSLDGLCLLSSSGRCLGMLESPGEPHDPPWPRAGSEAWQRGFQLGCRLVSQGGWRSWSWHHVPGLTMATSLVTLPSSCGCRGGGAVIAADARGAPLTAKRLTAGTAA